MDEDQPQIHNQGSVLGQNIGQYQQISQHFHVTGSEPTQLGPPERIWFVPYRRNPFFTGREDLLTLLHVRLITNKVAALTQPQAISGLGGIGKTQIALEYAYRYCDTYRYIFWIRAATSETLISDFATIADLLHLSEKDEQDQNLKISAIKRWLVMHEAWLLILDNADDLTMVNDFLPTDNRGQILLTTRAQALGTLAQQIKVETMGMAEATLFLLHRSKIFDENVFIVQASNEVLAEAESISIEMDFLPLALDQAGAYIEETGCNLTAYLDLYQMHRKTLLQRRGSLPSAHPEPVATTWSLSFQKVEQSNPAAADLLRLCAFLDPDSIPEDLFSKGGSRLAACRRANRSCRPCDSTYFPSSTVEVERERYEVMIHVPLSKGLHYEQIY